MAPCIAPLIKRKAKGHLQKTSTAGLEARHNAELPSRFMSTALCKRKGGFPAVVSRCFDSVADGHACHGPLGMVMKMVQLSNWYV